MIHLVESSRTKNPIPVHVHLGGVALAVNQSLIDILGAGIGE